MLTANDLQILQGFQFSLQFDPSVLEFQSFQAGLLSEDNIGLKQTKEGLIHISWHDLTRPVDQDPVLMKLSFRGLRKGQMSQVIGISDHGILAEAYPHRGQIMDVQLRFPDQTLRKDNFELFQNEPNPFTQRTKVRFFLPEQMQASLRFTDTSGKLLKLVKDEFSAGENEVWLAPGSFKGHGIIYYTLIAGPYTQTRKMIQLE